MKRSEAIKNLLMARTHPDLSALYLPSMEVQVNVAQGNGQRIDGDYKGRKWHGYTNGIETWKPIRIPHNARTDPQDNDYEINYNLAEHAEGIGMTGWDWKNRLSVWVGFDFDAIIGHADSHEKKLSETELKKIQDIVSQIPWVTVRASTGGRGLHLYVFFQTPVPTANHDEHAALARSILGLLASLTGFDFKSKVDQCGGILWVYHTKMRESPNGLKLLKQGEKLSQVPVNWKDHIHVVSGKSKKIVPEFIKNSEQSDDIEKMFDELTGQKTKIPLDEGHQKLIRFLHANHLASWWDSDLNMLVTHTHHLKRAHEELGLKGIFQTNSPGTDLDVQNTFAFPLRRGAWVVRRYTAGIQEAGTWTQDSSGYTRCFFNREPDLEIAARSLEAIEHKSGGFVFREAEVAVKAAETLGVNINLPGWANSRRTKMKSMRDGRLLVEITHDANDPADQMKGWLAEGKYWSQIFNCKSTPSQEPEVGNYDDVVRHLITESGDDNGWLLKSNNQWRSEPLVHVRTFLKSLNLKQSEAETILGACIAKPWRIVCRPFEAEILGDRDWNRKAPQLAFVPTKTDNLTYPSWLKILNHIGKGLNEAVSENTWAKSNGILTGADYLKCWISSVFKEPREPLPYLFLFGPQNSGKSILHEALSLLVTAGVVRADHALISPSGFNAELHNCVIAIVEETDLRKEKSAYNRIKDLTTSRYISIHAKNQTPFSVVNTCHWIQSANELAACPIIPGDARIVVIPVESLDEKELIAKKQLIQQLEKEAPDFLASVLAIELPESGDRLNIPVITTTAKRSAQESHMSLLEEFLNEECFVAPGQHITLSDLYDKFVNWMEPGEVHNWNRHKLGKEMMATNFIKGRIMKDNSVAFGNISFTKPTEETVSKYILVNGFLRIEK